MFESRDFLAVRVFHSSEKVRNFQIFVLLLTMWPMLSQKGKPLKVYEDFKFRKDKDTKEGSRWRCVQKQCTSFLITDRAGENLVRGPVNGHDHPPESNLPRQFLSNIAKVECKKDVSVRPKKIVSRELLNAPDHIRQEVLRNDLSAARRSIYETRAGLHPPLPKNIDETFDALDALDAKDKIKTAGGAKSLLVNDRANKIVVFGTEDSLRFLCGIQTVYMDGTFEFCVRFFLQLFTIHGIGNGNYVPLLFCLLPNKEKRTYEILFRHIVNKCMEYNLLFFPARIVVDFELAIHGAIRSTWVHVIIKGCLFHLTQAWWRKIQELGLAGAYRDPNSIPGSWLRWIFGLPFLNPAEVAAAFYQDFWPYAPAEVHPICYYMRSAYINHDATFTPAIWAAGSVWSTETTNACESFHAKYSENFNSSHPNLYVFLETFKELQEESIVLMRSTHQPRRQNVVAITRKVQLDLHHQQFRSGEISRYEYIKRLSKYYSKN